MEVLHWLACVLAGAVLTNAIPQLTKGRAGQRFATPFASPPGRGHSSDVAPFAAGGLVLGLWRARHFARVHDKAEKVQDRSP